MGYICSECSNYVETGDSHHPTNTYEIDELIKCPGCERIAPRNQQAVADEMASSDATDKSDVDSDEVTDKTIQAYLDSKTSEQIIQICKKYWRDLQIEAVEKATADSLRLNKLILPPNLPTDNKGFYKDTNFGHDLYRNEIDFLANTVDEHEFAIKYKEYLTKTHEKKIYNDLKRIFSDD